MVSRKMQLVKMRRNHHIGASRMAAAAPNQRGFWPNGLVVIDWQQRVESLATGLAEGSREVASLVREG